MEYKNTKMTSKDILNKIHKLSDNPNFEENCGKIIMLTMLLIVSNANNDEIDVKTLVEKTDLTDLEKENLLKILLS